jgi:hypothetical protein
MQFEGYGCVLVTTAEKGTPELSKYLQQMREFSAEGSLTSYRRTFQFLQQNMLPHPRSARVPQSGAGSTVAGMVRIPAAANGFDYDVTAQIDQGSDSQLYWENPQVTAPDPNIPAANAYNSHSMKLPIENFLIDEHPVTNAQYGAYLAASNYTPIDPYNYLLNWGGSRTPPASIAKKPVTYIGYKEATAYCKHVGKRLPHGTYLSLVVWSLLYIRISILHFGRIYCHGRLGMAVRRSRAGRSYLPVGQRQLFKLLS